MFLLPSLYHYFILIIIQFSPNGIGTCNLMHASLLMMDCNILIHFLYLYLITDWAYNFKQLNLLNLISKHNFIYIYSPKHSLSCRFNPKQHLQAKFCVRIWLRSIRWSTQYVLAYASVVFHIRLTLQSWDFLWVI